MKMTMRFAAAILAFAGAAFAQLPDRAGRDETVKLCSQCHEIARSISLRQDRDGWQVTMNKMVAFGMRASDAELKLVTDYLAASYPAEEVPRVNVNTARAVELEAGLSLRRSQSAAVLAWREKNGPFKSLEDLKKVPGLDAAHLEKRKNRMAF